MSFLFRAAHCRLSREIAFLILFAILAVRLSAASDDTLKGTRHLNFECSGSFGGKMDDRITGARDDILKNHGYFYTCGALKYTFNECAAIKTRLRIMNEELSSGDEYLYQFEPELHLVYRTEKWETSFVGGYINGFTLGSGLTVKEFTQSGAMGSIALRSWNMGIGVFTSGYGKSEDLYWCTAWRDAFPVKMSALLINTQGANEYTPFGGGQYYVTGYLLPSAEYQLSKVTFFAECGFRLNREKETGNVFVATPRNSYAGLVGVRGGHRAGCIVFDGCIELRACRKGFVPVTGVEIERFGYFWNERDSRANWVDFFDSRKDFYWEYMQLNATVQLNTRWHCFIRDELLYFYSRQNEGIVYPDNRTMEAGGVVCYKPSTHFYNIGISFFPANGVTVEVSVKNKLVNDPGFSTNPYSQWGQRFCPTDHPFLEAMAIWNMGSRR